MSANNIIAHQSKEQLIEQLLDQIESIRDLNNVKSTLESKYHNAKLADSYKLLFELGVSLPKIIERLNLDMTVANLSIFIKKYSTKREAV